MDSSRKEFKALNMAQPIRKQINETLIKLQTEKRKFLALQRQEILLKQDLQKAKRQFNETKLLQPKIIVKQNKNVQAHMSINNTDKIFLKTVNKISQLKTKVDVHRKQIEKYKKLTKNLQEEINSTLDQNNQLQSQLLKQQDKNQTIKTHLLDYRALNMLNTDEFKNSFHALNRSTVKEENERTKSQVLRRVFNNEELKQSKTVHLVKVEEQKSGSNLLNDQIQPNDLFMTNCIPLVKERIQSLIHKNKQKIKISDNYKKFGQELQHMFSLMKQYKGRDDVGFIADQFVMKEKQLKKIQQYIGKLENRLMLYQQEMQKIKNSDNILVEELQSYQNPDWKIKEKLFIDLQNQVIKQIDDLKHQQAKNTEWFNKIGLILSELANGEAINRGNIDKTLGFIEEQYLFEDKKIAQAKDQRLNKSPKKGWPNLAIQEKDIKAILSNELMSYEKLKQYAKEYISIKKQINFH